HLLWVPHGVLDGHLPAQAVRGQMIRRRLNELVEVAVEAVHQIVDINRLPRFDPSVQCGPLVSEEIGRVDVEMATPGVEVAVPTLGLFCETIDEDQGGPTSIRREAPLTGHKTGSEQHAILSFSVNQAAPHQSASGSTCRPW